jgi:uncharacterized protein YigE (DUF2233 family)
MKKILIYIFILAFIKLSAQVDTYNKIKFNNELYSAFSIRVDSSSVCQFSNIDNPLRLNHSAFVSNLIKKDSNIYLINSAIMGNLTNCITEGLFIEDFKIKIPLNNKNGNGNFYIKPNGSFLLTRYDVSVINTESTILDTNIRIGIQSGPILVNNSNISSSFNRFSNNKNIRSGVGIYIDKQNQKHIVFAISETPVSFFELSEFFYYKFNCINALSLESVNCAIYFPAYNHKLVKDKTICNYIGFKYN